MIKEVFSDWLTRVAALIVVLAAGTVIFNTLSHLPERYPLFGLFTYSIVPVLFAAGGVIFIIAILKYAKGEEQ